MNSGLHQVKNHFQTWKTKCASTTRALTSASLCIIMRHSRATIDQIATKLLVPACCPETWRHTVSNEVRGDFFRTPGFGAADRKPHLQTTPY